MRRVAIPWIVLLIGGCGAQAAFDYESEPDRSPWHHQVSASGPLTYEGEALWLPGSTDPLRVKLHLHNHGDEAVTLEYGECSFRVRLFRTASIREAPVWDDRPGGTMVCRDFGHIMTIPSTGIRTIHVDRHPPHEYLQLPRPGRYHAVIAFQPREGGEPRLVPAGVLDVR